MRSINRSRNRLVALPIVLGAMGALVAGGVGKAQAADTEVTFTQSNFVDLTTTATLQFTPTQADMVAGFKEATAGITLGVTTNSATGCNVKLSGLLGDSKATKIEPGDLTLNSSATGMAAAYSGTSYGAVTTTATQIWNTTTATTNTVSIPLNVKLINLRSYPGGTGAATKNYTNTLTFTVTAN